MEINVIKAVGCAPGPLVLSTIHFHQPLFTQYQTATDGWICYS